MKVKLKARGLWSMVQSGGGVLQEDMMALDVLSSAVPLEMVFAVASKDSAKEAWVVIKTLRVGEDHVRASTAQQLLRQFENATCKEEESIDDFSMRLSGMVQHIATLDETVDEPKVVGKFLCSVPHRYRKMSGFKSWSICMKKRPSSSSGRRRREIPSSGSVTRELQITCLALGRRSQIWTRQCAG
jgi:hypothetical protein